MLTLKIQQKYQGITKLVKFFLILIASILISSVIFSSIFQFISIIPNDDLESDQKDFDISVELTKVTPCIKSCANKYSNITADKHKICIKDCLNFKDGEANFFSKLAIISYLYPSLNTNNKSPDKVIKLIYFLIWFALFMQIFLTLDYFIFGGDSLIRKYYFQVVDKAVNSPPILGVIGTIYSFSVYTTNLKSGVDLIEGFKNSFFDASFTTIMAGFIYIINLYLKVIILKEK